jgi:hypothetical protein
LTDTILRKNSTVFIASEIVFLTSFSTIPKIDSYPNKKKAIKKSRLFIRGVRGDKKRIRVY